ncbi:MAG: ParA family protein [Lyngbya sp. HA4199-MV5]|jgi:chromosome partitioning protein|nr:ParA family protein [Lyngbya sp. HA4199-MV5]
MRVIAVHTSKGGVGKTTLVVNIAYELAKRNYRILVIDLDDQANASLSLGVNRADDLDRVSSLQDFQKILNSFKERQELINFLYDCDLPEFDYKNYLKASPLNLDLRKIINCKGMIDVLPSSYRTQDKAISDLIDPQNRLNTALQMSGISEDYDYVIVDTPPSSTDITKSGLLAAHYLLMPTQLEYLSAFGVTARLDLVRQVQRQSRGKRSVLLGIVPMMTQKRSRLNNMVRKLLERQIEGEDIPILSEIHQSDSIKQASHKRQPISLLAGNQQKAKEVAEEFSKLTQELLERIESIETDERRKND